MTHSLMQTIALLEMSITSAAFIIVLLQVFTRNGMQRLKELEQSNDI